MCISRVPDWALPRLQNLFAVNEYINGWAKIGCIVTVLVRMLGIIVHGVS